MDSQSVSQREADKQKKVRITFYFSDSILFEYMLKWCYYCEKSNQNISDNHTTSLITSTRLYISCEMNMCASPQPKSAPEHCRKYMQDDPNIKA